MNGVKWKDNKNRIVKTTVKTYHAGTGERVPAYPNLRQNPSSFLTWRF
jgi:hypothetical protein